MGNHCSRCVHDAFEQSMPGSGRGCPLLTKYYLHSDEDIPEWLDTFPKGPDGEFIPFALGEHPTCINFKPRGWRNPEPKPKRPPTGQDPLFEPPSGPLIYVDVADEVRPATVCAPAGVTP